MRPGNLTGITTFAGGATSVNGVALTIQIGSGANSADSYNGAAPINVSVNTVGDPTTPSTLSTFGATFSPVGSQVLPPSPSYRYVSPPSSAPSPGVTIPGPSASTMPNSNYGTGIANPYAPTLPAGGISSGPFSTGRGLASPLPGSVMPGSSLIPGNN